MLTDDDYKQAADALGCEVTAIKAVVKIESDGTGYLPDGSLKILFEAHIFHRFTKGRFDKSHPNLSSPKWNRKLYKGGVREWERMTEAMKLDKAAALMSASYGMFQIMGFNFALCGVTSVEEFIEVTGKSERGQLDTFVAFVKAQHLDDELQRKDWAGFARIYNGPGFKTNRYDEKMALAYAKEQKETVAA